MRIYYQLIGLKYIIIGPCFGMFSYQILNKFCLKYDKDFIQYLYIKKIILKENKSQSYLRIYDLI